MIFGALFSCKPADATVLKKCGKYASVDVGGGGDRYRVHNNIWNDTSKSHCIQVDRDNGAFRIVSASHNKSIHGAPAGYSFIHKGCHWGSCTNAEGNERRQVGSILEAKSSWSTTHTDSGVYNVAYDIWFHSTPVPIGQPDGAELMIWLAYKGAIQPVGSLLESAVSVDGAMWDVWAGWNGKNSVITYVRVDSVESVNDLSIKSFIADGVARNYIKDDWYLISVGAGFEIWKGGEGLVSNSFSLQLQ